MRSLSSSQKMAVARVRHSSPLWHAESGRLVSTSCLGARESRVPTWWMPSVHPGSLHYQRRLLAWLLLCKHHPSDSRLCVSCLKVFLELFCMLYEHITSRALNGVWASPSNPKPTSFIRRVCIGCHPSPSLPGSSIKVAGNEETIRSLRIDWY